MAEAIYELIGTLSKSNVPNFVKTVHKKPYEAIDPTQPAISAKGKTILITGGATGIGLAIARNFAAAGADIIVILARRASVLEAAASALTKQYPSTKIFTYPADVSNTQEITVTLEKVAESVPSRGIDVLITNAAYSPPPASAHETTEKHIRDAYQTNVIGNMHLVQEFLRVSSSHSKMILDVSTDATIVAVPNMGVYGATKYGFTYLLKHLQAELGEKIRVHSFHPGRIWTEATERFGLDKEATRDFWDDEDLPGSFAVWLASSQADFLKGKFVMASWDVKDLLEHRQAFEDPKFSTLALYT